MSRRILSLSTILVMSCAVAFLLSLGCEGATEFADPLYIKPGEDPFQTPDRYVMGVFVQPAGVNIAVGGLQRFKAVATFNDSTVEDVTKYVEWFTESPAIGTFEVGSSRFLAQRPGVAVVRCRLKQGPAYVISQVSYVNSFDPNLDNPPSVPLNPTAIATDEGVLVDWDLNKTDGDLVGYNLWRTQVSTAHYSLESVAAAHYAIDLGLVTRTPVLYPPYLDKTVVSGWYYYRITAEDLLGLYSAPSEEVPVFVTGYAH